MEETFWTLVLFGITCVGLLDVSVCADLVSGDVTLSATPDHISNGLTRSLTVNCSVTLNYDPDMSTVMSIILSKDDHNSGVNRGYVEVAALTSSSMIDNRTSSLGATASGNLQPHNDSYLALEWTYPSDGAIGLYMCQVYGMDADGHPVVKTIITSVSKENSGMKVVMQRLKELEAKLDASNDCCCKRRRQLKHARDALFEAISDEFNGKRYYMSHLALVNHGVYKFYCRFSGGYLAEIDSEDEYSFVKNFIDHHDAGHQYVALGGTDEGHEGNWTYLESDRPLSITHWETATPEPDWGGKAENCLFMSVAYKMFSWPCNGVVEGKYVCEIPAVSGDCQ